MVTRAGVLQVERIQNKELYQNFDEQRRRITRRWADVLPDLQVMMRLWHGTRTTDPFVIYDSVEGMSPALKRCLVSIDAGLTSAAGPALLKSTWASDKTSISLSGAMPGCMHMGMLGSRLVSQADCPFS